MRLLLFNLATDTDDPILGFTTTWICALAARVEFIHVITMRLGRLKVPKNVRVYSVGKEKGYNEARRAMEFYRILFRILREDHIDVCFSHMMPLFTVLAGAVLKANRIPIVTWYAHPSLSLLLKLAHHLSDRMIASLATAYPYRKSKLTAVGQGIDTELFLPNDAGPSTEPPMILCVGRLSPVKNHSTLFRAIERLQRNWTAPMQAVILGGPVTPADESYVRLLQTELKELGLENTVHFQAPVSINMLPPWYQRCTVQVNMTPTGSGDKVVWEAMSCGKICLAANEGFRETFGEYAGRLLFRHKDVQSLADALYWALALNDIERQRIGLYLREQVVKGHSLDHLAATLCDLFTGCVKRTGSRASLRVTQKNIME